MNQAETYQMLQYLREIVVLLHTIQETLDDSYPIGVMPDATESHEVEKIEDSMKNLCDASYDDASYAVLEALRCDRLEGHPGDHTGLLCAAKPGGNPFRHWWVTMTSDESPLAGTTESVEPLPELDMHPAQREFVEYVFEE